MPGVGLPAGCVTLLFTDIEGSTALLHELGEVYFEVLAQHHEIMRKAIAEHGGVEVKTEGDSFFVGFASASATANACLQMQRGLAEHVWPHGRPVRVRMGMHTGSVTLIGDDDYAGITVHEAARINSAGHGGQVLVSSATVEAIEVEGGLDKDVTWLDLGRHVLKDFPEPRQLFQLAHPGLPATFPPPRTLTARDHNLPAMTSALVGRGADVAELQRLLTGEARLVTITGAGGLGKTRLAVETAWTLLGRFREGAWLVDLALITDPQAIIEAVADALRVRDEPGIPLQETVVKRLSTGPTLLVLDNLEHLLDGVVVVAELLAACPTLVVLATSRAALRLRGEHELQLDGLAPEEGIALFVERARAARRDTVIDDQVAVLCERLDGMPLAIELAAARVRTHSVEQLVAAMDSALDLLSEGERDLPKRQQAMRAAIAWSVDQLVDEELAAFRELSVFLGGAAPEAINAVHGSPSGPLVASLADKSLVRLSDDRVTMLEPIRQYTFEKLAAADGELGVRVAAHARWCCDLAEEAEPHLTGPDQQDWLRTLSRDHANLRSAWERGDGDVPLRLAAALIRFWAYLGHVNEGRAVLRGVLSADEGGAPERRAKALLGAGHLAVVHGDLDEAEPLLVEAELLGDPVTAINAANVLGEVARLRGDPDRAEARYGDALRRAEALGDDRLVGLVRNNQGALAFGRGAVDAAAGHWREAIAAHERLGENLSLLKPLANLGVALLHMDKLAEAGAAFERSLLLARDIGDRAAEASALVNLGKILDQSDDGEGALARYAAALEIYEELGARRELATTLLSIAIVVADEAIATNALARSRALYVELGDAPASRWSMASSSGCETLQPRRRRRLASRAWRCRRAGDRRRHLSTDWAAPPPHTASGTRARRT